MSGATDRKPLAAGCQYLDRSGRRWLVRRVERTTAGRGPYGSLALAVAVDCPTSDPDLRCPQWFYTDTGRWSNAAETSIDLVEAL